VNVEAAAALYSSLNRTAQVKLLSRFGFNLTVAARDTYAAGSEALSDPRRLRQINEVQHRVFSHIGKLINNDPDRYPDDVLISMLLHHDNLALCSQAERAFLEAASYVRLVG
jgi:hypothetical protein